VVRIIYKKNCRYNVGTNNYRKFQVLYKHICGIIYIHKRNWVSWKSTILTGFRSFFCSFSFTYEETTEEIEKDVSNKALSV